MERHFSGFISVARVNHFEALYSDACASFSHLFFRDKLK